MRNVTMRVYCLHKNMSLFAPVLTPYEPYIIRQRRNIRDYMYAVCETDYVIKIRYCVCGECQSTRITGKRKHYRCG